MTSEVSAAPVDPRDQILPSPAGALPAWLARLRAYLPVSTDETFVYGHVFCGPAMTYANAPDGALHYGYTSCGKNLWVDLVAVAPEDVPARWQRQFVRHWQMRDGGEPVLRRCQDLHVRALREQPGDPYHTLYSDAWLCGAIPAAQVPAGIQEERRVALAKKHSFWLRNEDRFKNLAAFLAVMALFALVFWGIFWLNAEVNKEQKTRDAAPVTAGNPS